MKPFTTIGAFVLLLTGAIIALCMNDVGTALIGIALVACGGFMLSEALL